MKTRLAFLFIAALQISGCAGVYKTETKINPLDPLRVAVMPFMHVGDDGKPLLEDSSLAIDNVAILSSELKATPANILYQETLNTLSRTALDIISPSLVEAQLSHRGFLNPTTLELDLPRIYAADPRTLCKELFSCDAILYGTVTDWDRSYYAIQSVSTVGLRLKILSGRDASELFSAEAKDAESRGITKGPTGFSDLVIEPIKGLSNEIILDLAKNVVTKSLAPLTLEDRPEFLNTPPPAIFASSHDGRTPFLARGTPLTVVMLGSGSSIATFSIGTRIENIPMIETTEGHYIGEYYPLPQDAFNDEQVTIRLIDKYGRETKQIIGKGKVSLSKR